MPSSRDTDRQLDRSQLLSSHLLGLLAVFLVVLVSTQLAAGAVVASPTTAASTQDLTASTEPGDETPLDSLEPDTASDELSAEGEYRFSDHKLDYSLNDHGSEQGTTYRAGDSLPYEIGPTETTINTISSHAEDISPPVLLTLLGYSRYDSSDPLEHELRAALHDRIQSDAGLTLAELTSDTDVSESTVRYHTRILEEESLVDKVDLWGNVRLFPAGYESKERALTVAVDDTALKSVLSAVRTTEPATVTTIAAEIDRSPSTVSHHLSRLETADLVDRERNGKRVVTTLEPDVRRALSAGTAETETLARSVSD
ncbi:helix-turn-helix domain-containing protein [Halobacteriaceae archaeon SHR40]|uniref:winged helix-turn-helix transcriptional regulator n=1 Tax=Halovenus amylolytica TaxID=2500550 RepID=UPI000FE2C8F8